MCDPEQFIEGNEKGEVAATIVWDAVRAVIHGWIILWCAYNRRMKQLKLTDS